MEAELARERNLRGWSQQRHTKKTLEWIHAETRQTAVKRAAAGEER